MAQRARIAQKAQKGPEWPRGDQRGLKSRRMAQNVSQAPEQIQCGRLSLPKSSEIHFLGTLYYKFYTSAACDAYDKYHIYRPKKSKD